MALWHNYPPFFPSLIGHKKIPSRGFLARPAGLFAALTPLWGTLDTLGVSAALAFARRTHSRALIPLIGHKKIPSRGFLARPAGFEPTTLGFGGRYSIQLSYGRLITSQQYPIPYEKQIKNSYSPDSA